MAALSKVRVCVRLLAGIAVSNPAGDMDVCLLLCLGKSLCEGPISLLGKSYRVLCLSVISKPQH